MLDTNNAQNTNFVLDMGILETDVIGLATIRFSLENYDIIYSLNHATIYCLGCASHQYYPVNPMVAI